MLAQGAVGAGWVGVFIGLVVAGDGGEETHACFGYWGYEGEGAERFHMGVF